MRVIERNATGAISSRWPTGGCTEEAEDGGGKNEGKRRERERQRERIRRDWTVEGGTDRRLNECESHSINLDRCQP